MRTWVKVSIWSAIVGLLGFAIVAGTGSYYFLRHLNADHATEADTVRQIDAIRARFGSRQPLIEIVDPQTADARIHRSADPQGRQISTIHMLTWDADDGTRLQTEMPLWLMRFSTVNILSKLGVAPERFRLTVDDLRRYGPGIVVDYRHPGKADVLIWVD
jgi:hypothetical protein